MNKPFFRKKLTLAAAVLVTLLIPIFSHVQVNADAAGTGIPASIRSTLTGACSVNNTKTWWDLWFPSNTATAVNANIPLGGANYICGGARIPGEAPATSGQFFGISVKDATTGASLGVSSSAIGVGTTQRSQFSAVGATTVTNVSIPSGTCHTLTVTYKVTANYDGSPDTSGSYNNMNIVVCGPPPQPPPDYAPTGNITVGCSGSTPIYTATFSDGNGGTYGAVTNTGSAVSPGAQYGYVAGPPGSGMRYVDTSPTSNATIPYAAGSYISYFVVDDQVDQSNGNWFAIKSVVVPTCARPPTDAALASCSAISGTASDPDDASAQIRIDIYEGKDASQGGNPTYRQYSVKTVNHKFNIPLSSIETGNTNTGGNYNPNVGSPGPGPHAPNSSLSGGGLTDWYSQQFWIYAIGINTAGAEDGLNLELGVQLGPCGSVTCNNQTSFNGDIEVGSPKTFTVQAVINNATSLPPGATFGIKVNGTTVPGGGAGSLSGTTVISNTVSYTPTAPGTYSAAWTYYGASCGGGSTIVGYHPYFSVKGGDAAAGSGFGVGSSCSQAPSQIRSWNADNGPTYDGAGTQMAAFAIGQISAFVSGQSSSLLGGSPTALSFANTTPDGAVVNPTGSQYGGGFDTLPCITDYVADAESKGTTPGPASPLTLGAGSYSYKYTSGITINASALNPGQVVTIVVENGDVHINGNIAYNTASSIGDIPNFRLLVKNGSIIVDHSVTELDGFYDAEPGANPGSGTFASCAVGGSESTDYTNCKTKLDIYGAVVAGAAHFDRDHGSVHADAANSIPAEPSETIHYTPQLWIQNAATCTATPSLCFGSTSQWAAVTSLPPVL